MNNDILKQISKIKKLRTKTSSKLSGRVRRQYECPICFKTFKERVRGGRNKDGTYYCRKCAHVWY